MALDIAGGVHKMDCNRVRIDPAARKRQDGEGIARFAPHHLVRARTQLAEAVIIEAFESLWQILGRRRIGRSGQPGCAGSGVSEKLVGNGCSACGRRLLERQRGRGGNARRYRSKQEDGGNCLPDR